MLLPAKLSFAFPLTASLQPTKKNIFKNGLTFQLAGSAGTARPIAASKLSLACDEENAAIDNVGLQIAGFLND